MDFEASVNLVIKHNQAFVFASWGTADNVVLSTLAHKMLFKTNNCTSNFLLLLLETQGQIQSLERGCTLLKRLKTKKKKRRRRRSRIGEGSSNITMKLKYIIIIPIYSLTDKLHCLINTATALLELLTALLGYLDRLWPRSGRGVRAFCAPLWIRPWDCRSTQLSHVAEHVAAMWTTSAYD